jgi:Sulfate permease family
VIALLQAKAAGLWSRSQIRNNVLAGVVVGIVALPLAMAFAIASSAQHGIAGLQIATLMAGVILLVFGFARLGAVIKYIPNRVIVGLRPGSPSSSSSVNERIFWGWKLDRGGMIAHVGQENVIDSLEQALRRAKELQAGMN